jgi:hypothetical protein
LKIAILVEGKTEKAFLPHLVVFLRPKLEGRMPRLDMVPYNGRIPKEDKLRRVVTNLLSQGKPPADAAIALTDVYTGTGDFRDAQDAKDKMRSWVGDNDSFYPHVAQHDFEGWLLPFWGDIQRLAGHNRAAPSGPPESVDHQHPPSYHIREMFRAGTCPREYSKIRDGNRILRGKDLAVAAARCPELRAFLNTILTLSGGETLN